MADTLTTVSTFINSPPGQFAAGGVIAGVVWKFFERIEAVLTDRTKLEIAVWLVGREIGNSFVNAIEIFTNVFDRLFGTVRVSLRFVAASCLASYAISLMLFLTGFSDSLHLVNKTGAVSRGDYLWWVIALLMVEGSISYVSCLLSRTLLGLLANRNAIVSLPLIAVSALMTFLISILAFAAFMKIFDFAPILVDGSAITFFTLERKYDPLDIFGVMHAIGMDRLFVYPIMFSHLWLWLYTASGLILKTTRRLDIGFQWFNRRFDIEKKPLQSIGLVGGALVALVYWAAVIVKTIV